MHMSRDGGTQTTLASAASTSSSQDVWYEVCAKCDGSYITVWRQQAGASSWTQVLSTSSATETSATTFLIAVGTSCRFSFDDIAVVASSGPKLVTFGYDGTGQMTRAGADTYTYDGSGRVTRRTDGTYTATWNYTMAGSVAGYTSSYPGEGTVAYTVGGQLVARKVGTGNWINFDDDLNPIAQEDGTGGGIGAGGSPTYHWVEDGWGVLACLDEAADAWTYYHPDRVRSVRRVTDASQDTAGATSYSPFGVMFASTGSILDAQRFHGSQFLNPNAWAYDYAFRQYLPSVMRWNSTDVAGGLRSSSYGFVEGSPVGHFDELGLWRWPFPDPLERKKKECKEKIYKILAEMDILLMNKTCVPGHFADLQARVRRGHWFSDLQGDATDLGEGTGGVTLRRNVFQVDLDYCDRPDLKCVVAHEAYHAMDDSLNYWLYGWDYAVNRLWGYSPRGTYWFECVERPADLFMLWVFGKTCKDQPYKVG